MKKILCTFAAAALLLLTLTAQDLKIDIVKGRQPALAVPDFRGDAQAQAFMGAFNQTLWNDLSGSAVFRMVPKTQYPLTIPQQLADFKVPPPVDNTPPRKGQAPPPPPPSSGGGLWLSDWASPPAQANYVAIGYAAVQGTPGPDGKPVNPLFVLRGWLVDLSVALPANAQALAKTYIESPDEAGARKAAHEFAADILEKFGAKSLFGTHIYFVRRTGTLKNPVQEIWVMDPDGKNQKQITHFNALSDFPSVSPDGTKIAFNSDVHGNPAIFVFSVDPIRDLRFYNQRGTSVMGTPSFTPDGKQIVFMSSAGSEHCCRIFVANLDGGNMRPITAPGAIDAEPKVNPRTGAEIVFSSGRSGPEQLYEMSMDGTDLKRVSPGGGEASNPSWHPDGQFLAFAWTRGYMTGAFNIFVIDVAKGDYKQLTHGEGKNENPSWAPDGKHLVFMSDRTKLPQIWSMLADGTELQQLTTSGDNEHPVWGK
jgi:TolB protein